MNIVAKTSANERARNVKLCDVTKPTPLCALGCRRALSETKTGAHPHFGKQYGAQLYPCTHCPPSVVLSGGGVQYSIACP